MAGAAIALAGAGFSAYLLYVQVPLIDAVCSWCIVSDVLITLLAGATFLRLFRASQ